jgi:hypothetical protein
MSNLDKLDDGRDVGGSVGRLVLTRRTPSNQLQMMCQQVEARVSGHLADLAFNASSLKRQHSAAGNTHQVVVMFRLADGVTMAPIAGVNAIEYAQFSQEVKRAENRRTANPAIPGFDILPDFLGTEMILSRGHHANDGLARRGQSVPLFGQLSDDLGCVRHGEGLLVDNL